MCVINREFEPMTRQSTENGKNSAPADPFQAGSGEEIWIDEGIFVTEILNAPQSPNLSIARCRLPARAITQLHSLSVAETYIIESGTGRMRVGERIFDVRPGDGVRIGVNVAQNIENTGDTDLIFIATCTPRFTMEAYKAV